MTHTAIDAGRQTFPKAATPAPTNPDRSLEVVTTTLCLLAVAVYGSFFWGIYQFMRWTLSWIIA